MSACKLTAGNKWKVLEANLSVKEVHSLIIGETWCDSQFVGWNDIPLLGKISELRWKIHYKKIKMPREGFGDFEKCIWCGESDSSSHIFLECDTMKSRLLEWGVVRKLYIAEKEWLNDHVDSGNPLWKEKEVLMSIIKWSI